MANCSLEINLTLEEPDFFTISKLIKEIRNEACSSKRKISWSKFEAADDALAIKFVGQFEAKEELKEIAKKIREEFNDIDTSEISSASYKFIVGKNLLN